jgi:hypothetical protein
MPLYKILINKYTKAQCIHIYVLKLDGRDDNIKIHKNKYIAAFTYWDIFNTNI